MKALIEAIEARIQQVNADREIARLQESRVALAFAARELEKIKKLVLAEQERIVKELQEMRRNYMMPVTIHGSTEVRWAETEQSAPLGDAIKIIKGESP